MPGTQRSGIVLKKGSPEWVQVQRGCGIWLHIAVSCLCPNLAKACTALQAKVGDILSMEAGNPVEGGRATGIVAQQLEDASVAVITDMRWIRAPHTEEAVVSEVSVHYGQRSFGLDDEIGLTRYIATTMQQRENKKDQLIAGCYGWPSQDEVVVAFQVAKEIQADAVRKQ